MMHYKISAANLLIQRPSNSHYTTAATGRKILDEKEVKTEAKNAIMLNTSADPQGPTFVILNNHKSARVKKKIFIELN